MTMNQFAFIDPNSSDKENPGLVFHMTCSIEVGEAAACPTVGRKRRQADKDYQMIDVSYSVNGTHFHIDEGVVHALESTSSFTHLAPFATLAMAFTLL